MKKTTKNANSDTHRTVEASSTLNRKYVKRPSANKTKTRRVVVGSASEASARAMRAVQKANDLKRRQAIADAMNKSSRRKTKSDTPNAPATLHPAVKKARSRVAKPTTPTLSARERKNLAIDRAMKSVGTIERQSATVSTRNNNQSNTQSAKPAKQVRSRRTHVKTPGSGKRFIIAFATAAACVTALAFFVKANMPDISVRVAAMQTGIEATYPSYIPRGYSLANIVSEDGRIVMDFSGPENSAFTITEEKSAWDTTALLNNYVKHTWKENYTTTHEQGITIYISGSDAAWVNGGIAYTLDASSNNLTKKQIRNIVTSL